MKVIATIDYWDGSKSRTSQPTELENVMGQIRLVLCEKGVAGITITRCDGLKRLMEHTQPKEGN
jgi:hypothetical protein